MVKQFMKKRSKRVLTKTRTKIERKVREHNRKVRKDSKKGVSVKKAKRKDPGVPSSLPFKAEILQEAEVRKARLEEERIMQKEKARKQREKKVNKKRNLEHLIADTKKRTDDFNKKNHITDKAKEITEKCDGSLKAYYKEFKKVVQAADVVLEVLDARDPLGSRCTQVEEAVLAARPMKRLVLVLNKIDLIPRENAQNWITYLRQEFPTVAFKACTQDQTDKLSQIALKGKIASIDMLKSSRCLGADMLMNMLANYSQHQSVRTAISVGVVGFPNTGKSSVINSLKRSKACNVGATPGVTKEMQEVRITKKIKLLDSPGIVMATGKSDAELILRNCVHIESLDDPTTPVAAILARCNRQQMMLHYNITEYNDVNEFLALIARRYGQLRKGGVTDSLRAARTILHDWNNGRITYYTHPPETASSHISAEIRQEMSAGFDVESLLAGEQSVLAGLKQRSCTDIVVESSGPFDGLIDEPEEVNMAEREDDGLNTESAESMSEGEEDGGALAGVTVTSGEPPPPAVDDTNKEVKKNKKKASKMVPSKNIVNTQRARQGLLQLNLDRKKKFKKIRKERRRADVVSAELGTAFEGALAGMGGPAVGTPLGASMKAYDFQTDLRI